MELSLEMQMVKMNEKNLQEIVLLGPPLAGKTSIVSSLGDLKRAEIRPIYPGSGEPVLDRGVAATWTENGQIFRVSTLSGAVWDFSSWQKIVSPNAKLIFLMEVRKSSAELTMETLFKSMFLGLGPLAALQFTKTDLKTSVPTLGFESIRLGAKQVGLPCFESRYDRPPTLIAACCQVLGVPLVADPS